MIWRYIDLTVKGRIRMNDYQYYSWAGPEELSEFYKQMIIQRMQSKHAFLVDFLWLFLVLLPVSLLIRSRHNLSQNEMIICVIILAAWAFFLVCYSRIEAKKRVAKMQANEFVWRYGTVDRPTRDVSYQRPKSKIDGQNVSFIYEASEGDTVIVIGFNTAWDSKAKPKFYAVSIE